MTQRAEFAIALCEAVGLQDNDVSELTLRLKPGRYIEVEATLLVYDAGKLETLFREYRFEPIKR